MRCRVAMTILALLSVFGARAQEVPSPASPAISSKLQGKAEKGDLKAQFQLARAYETGSGVTQDYAEAVRWYERAAHRGEPASQCNLGRMYADGRGVARD